MTLREEIAALLAEAEAGTPPYSWAATLEAILARHPEPRRVALTEGTYAQLDRHLTDPMMSVVRHELMMAVVKPLSARYRLELVGPLPEPPR